MYNATYDWGTIEKPNFEVPQLNEKILRAALLRDSGIQPGLLL
jgi:hypothetical protein